MQTLEELTTDFIAKKINRKEFEECAKLLMQPFSEKLCFGELLGLYNPPYSILYTDDKENELGKLKDDAIYLTMQETFVIGKGNKIKTTQILPKTVNDFVSQVKRSGLDIPFQTDIK